MTNSITDMIRAEIYKSAPTQGGVIPISVTANGIERKFLATLGKAPPAKAQLAGKKSKVFLKSMRYGCLVRGMSCSIVEAFEISMADEFSSTGISVARQSDIDTWRELFPNA